MAEQQARPNMPPQPPYYPRRKSNWWIPLVIILAVIVIFFIVIASIIGSISDSFSEQDVEVKNDAILKLNLSGVNDYIKSSPFSFFSDSKQYSFTDVMNAIERAKTDDKIRGIYFEGSASELGWAKSLEIQKALDDFKESDKFIYTFMRAGNEFMYMNALPSDKIFMPKEGMLEMNGFSITSLFFEQMFEKLGIDFTIVGFEDFKSAAEAFGRSNYSDSARYQLQVLIDQRNDAFLSSIEKYRGKSKDEVQEFLAKGHFTVDSIYAYGYIDELATKQQVMEIMEDEIYGKDKEENTEENEDENAEEKEVDLEVERDLNFISIGNYIYSGSNAPGMDEIVEDKKIAIIYATGPIVDLPSSFSFNEVNYEITPDEYVGYIEDAMEDDDIDGVLIRINSPGGSVIASDAIWNAIVECKKVKPVYASMGDVAASGGYYIPMACDTIVAHPQTITGSIGVIASIPNFSGTLDKIGVTVDTISTSENAYLINPAMPIQDEDVNKLKMFAKNTYFRFVQKVADARGKTFEETRALAKGRVWTGKDAYDRGLVDALGGFEEAIALLKERIGVDRDKLVSVKVFPGKEDEFEAFLKAFGLNSNVSANPAGLKALSSILGADQNQVKAIFSSLPKSMQKQIMYNLTLLQMAQNENVLMAMPMHIVMD